MQARGQGSNYTQMWLRASWDERDRERERQAAQPLVGMDRMAS